MDKEGWIDEHFKKIKSHNHRISPVRKSMIGEI
jgi:hypothetical protein